MLQYKRGDLFSASGPNIVLVHACNCKGSWGAGIATQFRRNFPLAHKDYQELCHKHDSRLLGMGVYHKRNDSTETPVGYLFTSLNYGKAKDSKHNILKNTKKSITCLLNVLPKDTEVCSPKINAGLFAVPWEETEQVIVQCLKTRPDVKWTVYEL